MAFKQKGYPMHKGTASHTGATAAWKKTWKEAYQTRDMDTYGDMSESEYIAEAKRQKEVHSKTGKWDVKGRPQTSKTVEPVKGKDEDAPKDSKTTSSTVLPGSNLERNREKTVGIDPETGKKTGDKTVEVTDSSGKVVKSKTVEVDPDTGDKTKTTTKSDSTRKTNRKAYREAKDTYKDALKAWRKGGRKGDKPEKPKRKDYMRAQT